MNISDPASTRNLTSHNTSTVQSRDNDPEISLRLSRLVDIAGADHAYDPGTSRLWLMHIDTKVEKNTDEPDPTLHPAQEKISETD